MLKLPARQLQNRPPRHRPQPLPSRQHRSKIRSLQSALEILRRQQEAEAELAALSAEPAPAAAAATPAAGISSLPVSEQDAILAELDNLV
ncbi:hypothetical protein U8P73_35920 (plasmid) [Rhizobium beringeri]|uniref:hypothetical protein n=1 Tax=Rhizobium beringeri TaxID=3019934 RepID=UPI002DDD7283|nr:hypothetical protein [Rhizobium beringeri]WSG93539.1 hypothetical protein U8P73_35920 [Rhizobium beringeri]